METSDCAPVGVDLGRVVVVVDASFPATVCASTLIDEAANISVEVPSDTPVKLSPTGVVTLRAPVETLLNELVDATLVWSAEEALDVHVSAKVCSPAPG